MPQRDIVVIGGSAGAIESASEIVSALPAEFSAAMFVVVHFPGSVTSALPRILSRSGPLRAEHASNEDPIQPGRIYVAPPNCHMFLEGGRVRLTRGPKENGHRPAIDPLFRSAAHHYGARVIGVLLSGNLSDGTAGLLSIKQQGGVAIVQNPGTALYSGMPQSAVQRVQVDHIVPVNAISQLLKQLTTEFAPTPETVDMEIPENERARLDEAALEDRRTQAGLPSTMSCPECHGVLWEHRDADVLSRPSSWRPRCGRHCGRWRSTRRSPAGWPIARRAGGMPTPPPHSPSMRWTPSTTRPPSVRCWRPACAVGRRRPPCWSTTPRHDRAGGRRGTPRSDRARSGGRRRCRSGCRRRSARGAAAVSQCHPGIRLPVLQADFAHPPSPQADERDWS